jgi:phospholipase C
VGGHVYSQVADHTSPLQLIEAITEAGGLAGKGPVTFDAITPWRRSTFDDLAGAFQAVPQAAPVDAEFDPAARQANYSAQLSASALPMPARPRAAQTVPHQLPVAQPTGATSGTTTGPAAAAAGGAAAPAIAAGAAAKSTVTAAKVVRSGRKAAVRISGARPSSRVVVRHAHGAVVGRASVAPEGTALLRIPTRHLKAGHKHRYTVMYVDAAGRHHTRNVAFKVTG